MAEATDHATRADVQALDQKLDLNVLRLDQKLDAVGDQVRYVGILLEQMRSEFRAFGEALSEKASRSDLETVEKRLGDRISLLESAALDNSREISKNTDDVRLLRTEVAQLIGVAR